MTEEEYIEAIKTVIKSMKSVIGRVAITVAKNVKEIKISENGEIIAVENPETAFKKLICEYEKINAVAPMLIARFLEKIEERGGKIPEKLPKEIKKWMVYCKTS